LRSSPPSPIHPASHVCLPPEPSWLNVYPDKIDTVDTVRWEMGYMIVISGVVAIFSWNAGNRALTPINGILFINLVPVTTFAISILSGYNMSKLEVTGAIITIAALVSNNLYQRKLIRIKSAIPPGVLAADGATK
jgi:drug/metabolite transporter (DMT)-like permease